MEFTLVGSRIDVRLRQPEKMLPGRLRSPSESVTLDKPVQLEKIEFPMSVAPEGIEIAVKLSQFLKALSPILTTPEGMTRSVSAPHSLKA